MTQRNETHNPWRRTAITALVITVATLIVTMVSLKVAVDANRAADDAQEAIELVVAQRTESRLAACLADNSLAAAFRLKAETTASGFEQFAALLIGDRPIEGQIADSYAEFQRTVIDPQRHLADPDNGPFKPRDCSPEGIRAFYEGDKP